MRELGVFFLLMDWEMVMGLDDDGYLNFRRLVNVHTGISISNRQLARQSALEQHE